MDPLTIVPYMIILLLVCLPKILVEMLVKSIDIAISDLHMIRLPNYKVELPSYIW